MLDLQFFMILSVQSSEAVIPVCLINPITLDYFKSPGIKNSAQIWLVIWNLIRKRLFSLLLFYEWDITKTLIMQHALMHKRLQRLTHTNIHISPEEEGPQGLHGAICVENRQHTRREKNVTLEQEKDTQVKDCRCCKWQEASWCQAGGGLWPGPQQGKKRKKQVWAWLSTTSIRSFYSCD